MADGGKVTVKIDGDDSGFKKSLGKIKSSLKNMESLSFEAISGGLSNIDSALKTGAGYAEAMASSMQSVQGTVSSAFALSADAAYAWAQNTAAAYELARLNAQSFGDTAGEVSGGLNSLQSSNEQFGNAVMKIWSGMEEFFTSEGQWLSEFFGASVPDIFKNSSYSVRDSWRSVSDFITNPVSDAAVFLYGVNPKFKEWSDGLVQSFKSWFSGMKSVGSYIVEGLWNGINGKSSWLKSKVAGVVAAVKSSFTGKKGFDIHSPSKWSRAVGEYIGEGLILGISDLKSRVVGTVTELVTDSRSEVKKVMDELGAAMLESEVTYAQESERLKDCITEENKKYLEDLKRTAEQERKIYEARQKDIKSAQESIADSFKSLAENAFDSIEEVEKSQKSLADKLKNFGGLYNTEKKTIGGKEFEFMRLADIESQTKALEDYAEKLLLIKEKSNVPKEFFETLRDLSVEEGTKFADKLLKADDEAFARYIENWKEKQAAAEEISKILYTDEAEAAKKEIVKSFDKFDSDLDAQGRQNAEAWGAAFLEKVKEQIPGILGVINSAFGDITAAPSYAGAGGGTVNNYTQITEKGPIKLDAKVELDGREFGKIVFDQSKREASRRGTTLYKK